MENFTLVLVVMSIMLVTSGIAEKFKLPAPIILIVIGMLVGCLPAMPRLGLSPEIVMLLFLPPLLYDAAFNISFKDFRTNFNTISSLAFGLVFITAAGIALIAKFVIPGMTWPLAFVLGAILSATDAIAAIGITKGLGLSHKTLTILEGESLINDASSLIAYRFAVAAVTGASFVWWQAGLDFLVVLAGGFIVGFILSRLMSFAILFFKNNELVVISLTLLMPFTTYLVAEHFEVSGVIAVVVLGLSMSWLSKMKFPEPLKKQSRNFWDVIIYLLNGLIFVLIGLQFPIVLKEINSAYIWHYIAYALIITVVAFLIRLLRLYWQQLSLDRAFKGKRKVSEEALFDRKTALILSWSGMRGIVSLAIALGLPAELEDKTPFPMRNELIFISIAVVLFSLLGQGLTLPWVLKKINKDEDKIQQDINTSLP